jgi:hypothetical protein
MSQHKLVLTAGVPEQSKLHAKAELHTNYAGGG